MKIGHVFVRKYKGPLSACDVCGAPSETGYFAATMAHCWEGGNPTTPPGVYDNLGFLCETCGRSPQLALSRGVGHLAAVADTVSLIGATNSDGGAWGALPEDAIILPIVDGADLVLRNGRWTLEYPNEGVE